MSSKNNGVTRRLLIDDIWAHLIQEKGKDIVSTSEMGNLDFRS
jgi:hypothetical protein